MIHLENVSYTYRKGFGLANIDFTIDDGEFVFLIGPTGSGKSTLLNLLYMEIFPESGTVTIGKFDSDSIKKRQIPASNKELCFLTNYWKSLTRTKSTY